VSPVAVLRTPGVARLLTSCLVGRVPQTAIGLLLLLRVRDLGGSYAVGGIAAGAFSLGLAFSSPLLGRAVDTRGQTRVLQVGAWVTSLALLALALLPDGTPAGPVLLLAFVCGAAHPPLSACLRTLWGTVLPDADARHAAFALEAPAQELCFIFGPLLLVSAVAVHDPSAALALCAVILLGGTLTFVATPASRDWRGSPRAAGAPRVRALGAAGVRTLLLIGLGIGCSFGAIEVAITASAEAAGARGQIGVLMAVWGVGSILGGLLAARGGAPADRAARVVLLLVVLTVCDALLVVAGPLWVLGMGLVLCGAAIAPLFTIVFSLAGDLARTGTVTEVFTWLSTGISAGVAAGAAAAGAMAEGPLGPGGGFAAGALMVGAAALSARLRVGTLAV
jgi:predicted MFS family arabinose efflux permease